MFLIVADTNIKNRQIYSFLNLSDFKIAAKKLWVQRKTGRIGQVMVKEWKEQPGKSSIIYTCKR